MAETEKFFTEAVIEKARDDAFAKIDEAMRLRSEKFRAVNTHDAALMKQAVADVADILADYRCDALVRFEPVRMLAEEMDTRLSVRRLDAKAQAEMRLALELFADALGIRHEVGLHYGQLVLAKGQNGKMP